MKADVSGQGHYVTMSRTDSNVTARDGALDATSPANAFHDGPSGAA